MLTSLTIERLRGVRHGTIEGCGRVNLLVGPNGAGKSTVLEALCLLSAAAQATDPVGRSYTQTIMQRRNEAPEAGSPFPRAWWFRLDRKQPIDVSMKIGHDPNHITSAETSYHANSSDPKTIAMTDPAKRRLSSTLLIDVDTVRDPDIERRLWDDLFRLRLDKQIAPEINRIYGLGLEHLTAEVGTGRLLAALPNTGLPLDALAAGVRMAIRLLIVQLATRGSLLLLEEIDAFQSRQSLLGLAECIVRLARAHDGQVFISTHRHLTIEAFLKAGAPEGDVVVLPLQLDAEGELRGKAMQHADAVTFTDAGGDVRDLFRLRAIK